MKENDKAKFKDILDWVARNYKKTLAAFEYKDAWNDLNAYNINQIEQAASYIRSHNKFYPCLADWKAALSATYKPEIFPALPEPPQPETSSYKLWGHLHVQALSGDYDIPDAYSHPIEFCSWMRDYLLKNGIEQKRVNRTYPKDSVPSWIDQC